MSRSALMELAKYNLALESLKKEPAVVTEEDRGNVEWFLRATAAEDAWLHRKAYIDGSPAMLMRSLIFENGSKYDQMAALDFYRLRPALRAFVAGEAFPQDLLRCANVSIRYWMMAADMGEQLGLEINKMSAR